MGGMGAEHCCRLEDVQQQAAGSGTCDCSCMERGTGRYDDGAKVMSLSYLFGDVQPALWWLRQVRKR